MKNGIRKILEFIKKIMPLIIIIVIFLAIKFHPKFLTITDFLGITNKQEDISNLISYIELFIECGFLYFVLKEFKMTKEEFKMTRKEFEMTRKEFEWQEEEYDIKTKQAIERKLKVICGFVYKWLYENQCILINQDSCKEGILCINYEGEEEMRKFLNKFSIPFRMREVLADKSDLTGQQIRFPQTNINDFCDAYMLFIKSYKFQFVDISKYQTYFSDNTHIAYHKINQCYDNIHNYWKTQRILDQNDDSMIKMIWEQEK